MVRGIQMAILFMERVLAVLTLYLIGSRNCSDQRSFVKYSYPPQRAAIEPCPAGWRNPLLRSAVVQPDVLPVRYANAAHLGSRAAIGVLDLD